MAGGGDFQGRPDDDHCVMAVTQEMVVAENSFNTHAILVNIGQDQPRTELRHVTDAFCWEFVISLDEVRVSPHFPEDFFVFLTEQRVREDAVDKERFHSNGHEFQILPWAAERHTELVFMPYHMRLCVENVPAHTWTFQTTTLLTQ